MSLARRVRDYRFAKGWGPDELSSRASISRTALYQIESGKTETPRAATLQRIAHALGLPPEVLLKDLVSPEESGRVRGMRDGLPTLDFDPSRDRLENEGRHRLAMQRLGLSSADGPQFHGDEPFRLKDFQPAPGPETSDLVQKFRQLLDSPLGESLTRIVEDSHRLLITQGRD